MREIIYYLSEVLFWFRPPMGASRVKIYCDEIVISDAIMWTVNQEITLFTEMINIIESGNGINSFFHSSFISDSWVFFLFIFYFVHYYSFCLIYTIRCCWYVSSCFTYQRTGSLGLFVLLKYVLNFLSIHLSKSLYLFFVSKRLSAPSGIGDLPNRSAKSRYHWYRR